MEKKYLITGASGQIGTDLSIALIKRYGADNVVISGYSNPVAPQIDAHSHQTITLDVTNPSAVEAVIKQSGITTIYHLAGVLSAVAEANPELAWMVNVNGLRNILDAAVTHQCAVFFPSSIGAFGPQAPADLTPQETIQRPTTNTARAAMTLTRTG